MTDPLASPVTDPTALYAVRDSLYAADMLIAAVSGLDFFTWLDEHPGTVDEIAARRGFHRRPVDVMTTLFVAMGLLERDGARLRTTATAREHLVAQSRWYLGPYYPKVADRPIARDLIDILRSGAPARFASRPDEEDWHRAMETETFAEEFTAAMNTRGLLTAPALAQQLDLSSRQRLLDIAGGSGVFACAMAERFTDLRASVLEKAPVDRIAARSIARRHLADRVDTVVGDMLAEPLPHGYDVHLLSNVLHDWDEPVVRQLLAASAQALRPGGLLIVHDTFLNATKTGPLAIAEYSVLLMHVTQGRCYSVAEIESWLGDAGFSFRGLVPSAIGRSAILAERV
ncbi:MAG: methyltransferase [Vicinamibacterales bacterium]